MCWPSDLGWISVNLGFYCWGWGGLASVCPSCFFWLDSHIHVWNMSRGWMAQSFMVRWNMVVPPLVGLWHSLIRNSFPWFSCVNVLMYMWILWLIFLWYLCPYYVVYMYVWWQQLCMDLNMILLVNECIMYRWPDRW